MKKICMKKAWKTMCSQAFFLSYDFLSYDFLRYVLFYDFSGVEYLPACDRIKGILVRLRIQNLNIHLKGL